VHGVHLLLLITKDSVLSLHRAQKVELSQIEQLGISYEHVAHLDALELKNVAESHVVQTVAEEHWRHDEI
jgi:hypothetical protein